MRQIHYLIINSTHLLSEATKTCFDKICQKEPWKNLAVLGDALPGIVIIPPSNLLMNYWQEHLGFSDSSRSMMDCSTYLDGLSQSSQFDKLISLFPFDHLSFENTPLIQIFTTTC